MRRFLQNSDLAYADLERRARATAYINFPQAELPPGCVPAKARIGLKIDPESGEATLFVERGVRYYGGNQAIRRWTQGGQISFPDFTGLRRWICCEIKAAFSQSSVAAGPANRADPGPSGSAAQAATTSADAAPAQRSEQLDPGLKNLLEFLVRQIARNYGIEVQSIDALLLEKLHDKLGVTKGQAACDAVVDDLLGGAFALASVEGHRHISLHAGPPISCKPIDEEKHD